jgi:cytochrome c-type biogenesis protein CcsB
MSETYAGWSNTLVYGALMVLTVALVALAAEAAFGSRGAAARRARALTAVGGGGAGAALPPPGSDAEVGPAPGAAERVGRMGTNLVVLGTGLLGLAVLTRGLAAGRPPWGNMYEFAITGSFLAGAVWLGLLARYPALRATAVWLVATVLTTLGISVVVLYVPAGPLLPALRSSWLVIHVLAAMLSAAVFTVAMVTSALQIVREKAEQRGSADRGYVRTLPSAARLDALSYRVTAFAFPVWTFAVVAGAVWASQSWGRAWGWDPKEVWALVTWLAYAAYLHARTTAGWQGRRASVLALAAYATLLFNFFGVNLLFAGLHAYAK